MKPPLPTPQLVVLSLVAAVLALLASVALAFPTVLEKLQAMGSASAQDASGSDAGAGAFPSQTSSDVPLDRWGTPVGDDTGTGAGG